MGVLACDRAGCESIMCDNVSHEYGYLCNSCKQELIERGECDIEAFMHSSKEENSDDLAWEEYINNVFRNRFDEDEVEDDE